MAGLIAIIVGALAFNVPSSPAQIAERHFARVLKTSTGPQATSLRAVELDLTPSYVVCTLTFNFMAHVVAAREFAAFLQLAAPTLWQPSLVENLHGLAWGVPGALAVAAIEQWRCGDPCSVAEESAGECLRCSAVTNPIFIGTAPLAILSNAILADAGVGERSVRVLTAVNDTSGTRTFDGAPASLPSSASLLAAGGAIVSCAWAQGIFQGGACGAFREATMRLAMACVDCSTAAVTSSGVGVAYAFPAFPLFAARAAVEPAFVVMLTAAVVTILEMAISRALQPETTARTQAATEALGEANRRAHSLFALEMDVAGAKEAAACFEAQVDAWHAARDEATRKDLVASAGRAAVAASVFAASGGCLASAVVCSLGVAADDWPAIARSMASKNEAITWAAAFPLLAVLWACGSSAVATLPAGW